MKRHSVALNKLQLRPDQLRDVERELANAEIFVELWFTCGDAVGGVLRAMKITLQSLVEHWRGKAIVPRPRA